MVDYSRFVVTSADRVKSPFLVVPIANPTVIQNSCHLDHASDAPEIYVPS